MHTVAIHPPSLWSGVDWPPSGMLCKDQSRDSDVPHHLCCGWSWQCVIVFPDMGKRIWQEELSVAAGLAFAQHGVRSDAWR